MTHSHENVLNLTFLSIYVLARSFSVNTHSFGFHERLRLSNDIQCDYSDDQIN